MGYDPNEPRDSRGRWGRMNSTSKAKLTASARFKGTSQSAGAMRGRAIGEKSRLKPATVAEPFKPSSPEPHAVAIMTAKALDRDFHAARDKANKDAMHAALAKASVPIIKLPPGPKPKYGAKGKMK